MDILTLIMQAMEERLNAAETLTEAMAREIEEGIRRNYGGEYHYLAKTHDKEGRLRRNHRLFRDHQQGEHIGLLSRRYGLSRKQVQRILAEMIQDGTSTP